AREPTFAVSRRDWTGTANRNPAAPENRSTTLFPGGFSLVAGQRYCIEAIMKEGSGADHLAVAVQMPGAPVPANDSTPIPGEWLGVCITPGSLAITKQPANMTVSSCCTTVCFMVSATNTGPCGLSTTYQWYVNGAPIPGATSDMYCITNPTAADNGSRFSVAVSCGGQTVVSQFAELTVVQDTTPPAISSASIDCVCNKITLLFDDCLDRDSAAEQFNYIITSSGGGGVDILAVTV